MASRSSQQQQHRIVSRRTRARMLALVLAASAVLVAVATAASGLRAGTWGGLALELAAAVVIAGALVRWPGRVSDAVVQAVLAGGILMLAAPSLYGDTGATPFVPLMIGAGIFAAAFCPPRQALADGLLIAAVYAAMLAFGSAVDDPAARWIVVAGALALAMTIPGWLLRQLRDRADEADMRAERLVEAENRATAILDAAHTAFVASGADDVVVGWNREAERLLGWSRAEAVGRRAADLLVPARLLDAYEDTRRAFLATGHAEIFDRPREFRVLTKAGDELPVLVSMAATADADGLTFSSFLTDLRERLRREEQARERVEDLEALARATRSLADTPGAKEARHAVCQAAQRMAGSAYALLFEPDLLGRELVCTAVSGGETPGLQVPFAGRPSGVVRAFAASAAEFVADAGRDPALPPALAGSAAAYFQPVLAEEGTRAVLVLGWRGGAPAPRERTATLLRLLAEEAGVAIERADALARLKEVARTDELTGLSNRRGLGEELRREVGRASRSGAPLCIAMLDLDHFKRFNDALGHQEGDRLLHDVAVAWSGTIRPGDLLARYGGEEFTLVLSDTELPEAIATVQRLREQVPAGQTCSAGVALWDGSEPADDLVGRADRALYEAKRSGRDRIVSAEPRSTE
jgi:diguanylate cyclase (GGDEF)-like protein/PAS domain S-box-containing protein